MMRTLRQLSAALAFIFAAATAYAQDTEAGGTIVLGKEIAPKDTTVQKRFKNHLIAPKGEWQCGISVMYADFSSADTEYMLLLNGVGADASMLRLAPEAAYTLTSIAYLLFSLSALMLVGVFFLFPFSGFFNSVSSSIFLSKSSP